MRSFSGYLAANFLVAGPVRAEDFTSFRYATNAKAVMRHGGAVVALLLGLLMSSQVSAGSQVGKVVNIVVRASDGLVLFNLTGEHANRPGCAASQTYWMIKNENSETGKRQLALLLTARATGAPVAVTGANTCSRWIDGEDVDVLQIENY